MSGSWSRPFRGPPTHELVIFNDAEHCYAYVERVLGSLRPSPWRIPPEEQTALASTIHQNGHAAVGYESLEEALVARRKVLAAGKDVLVEDSSASLVCGVKSCADGTWVERPGREGDAGFALLDDAAIEALHKKCVEKHGAR